MKNTRKTCLEHHQLKNMSGALIFGKTLDLTLVESTWSENFVFRNVVWTVPDISRSFLIS